ncbi:hypothetical protein FRB99_006951 [Tulasnella sp. 403]|nr:hypothetical protein FRB99_006951 [Tulasnella sp. 403]
MAEQPEETRRTSEKRQHDSTIPKGDANTKAKRKKVREDEVTRTTYIEETPRGTWTSQDLRTELGIYEEKLSELGPRLARPLEPETFQLYFDAHRQSDDYAIKKLVSAIEAHFKKCDDIPASETEAPQVVALLKVQKIWNEHRQVEAKYQAPSTFAQSSNWVAQQAGPAAINCLRPTERAGLPITLLHPAFARFWSILAGPLPHGASSLCAQRTAFRLCEEMPQYYATDKLRLAKFQDLTSDLFSAFGILRPAPVSSGEANLCLVRPPTRFLLVGEAKNNPGGGDGDVWMHVSALYDAVARAVPEEEQRYSGCPAFILAIDGPNILIGGGFRDGGRSVVEPLSQWCIMMKDKRVWKIFTHHDQTDKHILIEFTSPLQVPRDHYDLVFKGKVITEESGPEQFSEDVFVKVLRGRYGRRQHQMAAKDSFAPKFFGVARCEGAPDAIVMQLLSRHDGWNTMGSKRYRRRATERQVTKLRQWVADFLSWLETHKFVHGDLRSNNIMCRLHQNGVDIEIRVVDWDWAGEVGEVRYPPDLNPEANLPGAAGGLIEKEHDRQMLMETLDCFLSSE